MAVSARPLRRVSQSTATSVVDVSVLVPAKDEAGNLALFLELCEATFRNESARYEVVVVDDGSTDGSWALLQELRASYPFLRPVRHRAQRGIAEALRTGYLQSHGRVLVFYPADLQFKPEDIPRLVNPILAGESDMVTGYKQGKYEKAFVSGIYNKLSRTLFHVPVRDLNNVKAYRREIMAALPMRPDFHRYMIVMAAAQGFTVTEVPVPLYARHSGRSKFGLSRIPIGVLDMLAVWFELKFGQKPLLAFGMLGVALFALGVLSGLGALVWLAMTGQGQRWVWTVIQTCLMLGSIFFATGLLGEQIAQQRSEVRELRRELGELASAQHDEDADDVTPSVTAGVDRDHR
ncbi:glycosyltransferase family 2 protein [Gemmatimonas groenlandica]|uniref:Glycosyltransferase family 2 protein n=1 Tax=Gemmatimonas groenlandica TaxID=2732249 RepID=A0A6M4IJ14_9BACT|nr:glycosyltransferase family 2 protein [Gemmatimonas groenlandica]QJR35084.1 glycosyltransferase family 2 protein [Gemmatimonas groenlandica]